MKSEQETLEAYKQARAQIEAVLESETNQLAQMATINCILKETFPEKFFWTGFYLVDPANPKQLVVGPYQGTMGCLRIDFGRGVCGTAAETMTTQVVDDVNAIPNHIACDARSRSEIVVPVRDAAGQLIGVFDVDSTEVGSFNHVDQLALEGLMASVFGQ